MGMVVFLGCSLVGLGRATPAPSSHFEPEVTAPAEGPAASDPCNLLFGACIPVRVGQLFDASSTGTC
jgi:hypothetical protein